VAGIAFFADTSQPTAMLGAVTSLVASFAYASVQAASRQPAADGADWWRRQPPTALTAAVVLVAVCAYLALSGQCG